MAKGKTEVCGLWGSLGLLPGQASPGQGRTEDLVTPAVVTSGTNRMTIPFFGSLLREELPSGGGQSQGCSLLSLFYRDRWK